MEKTTINQRIKMLVDELDEGNKLAFSKRVGMSNQGLGEIIGERQSSPSYPKLEAMLRALPQVRIEWLLLGEGEMLKSAAPKEPDAEKINIIRAQADIEAQQAKPDQSITQALASGTIAPTRAMVGHFDYPVPPHKSRPLGQDLIEQVETNTRELQDLTRTVAQLKQRLKKLEANNSQH